MVLRYIFDISAVLTKEFIVTSLATASYHVFLGVVWV